MKSARFHGHEIWQISWNSADFMAWNMADFMARTYISVLVLMKNTAWNLADFMQFGRFHGHEIRRISWNSANFMVRTYIFVLVVMKIQHFSGRPWDPVDFMNLVDFMHEIWWISWNLVDFMKFGRFHHEIRQISWNLVDFMPRTLVLMKNTAFSGRPCNTVYLYWFWRKSTIHEIQWISCEIRQISWNPADFMMKSGKISSMKSGGFHGWSWKMQTWKCKFSNKIVVGVLIKFSSIVQIVNSIKAKRCIRIDFKTNSCKTVIKGLFSSLAFAKDTYICL